LLKRVFNIDLEHCSHWGGELTVSAALEEPHGDRQNPEPSRLTDPATASPTGPAIRSV
jgi:hypothetical protein